MTPEVLADFRRRLQEIEGDLRTHLNDTVEGSEIVELDSPIGRDTRIEAIQLQKMNNANRVRAKARLQLVMTALEKIESDEELYGLCGECGEDIGQRRLEVRPESPLCLSCQSELEGGVDNGKRGRRSRKS